MVGLVQGGLQLEVDLLLPGQSSQQGHLVCAATPGAVNTSVCRPSITVAVRVVVLIVYWTIIDFVSGRAQAAKVGP